MGYHLKELGAAEGPAMGHQVRPVADRGSMVNELADFAGAGL